NVELNGSECASQIDGVLVRKGEALPSVIGSPPAEAPDRSDHDQDNGELRRLRDELAAVQATLKDREAEVAQMRSVSEQVQKSWIQQTQDSLRKAEQAWQAEEAARFAAVEARWRDDSARALVEARTLAEVARDQSNGTLQRLRDELAAVEATLKDREAELGQM